MVKKQQTDKKPKTDEYVGVKKTDVKKTADLIVQQDEMIRTLMKQRNIAQAECQRAEQSLAEAIDLSEHRRDTIEKMTELAERKHELFNQLYTIAEIDNKECQRLEKHAKAYKVAFWIVLTTLAVIVVFAPFIKASC